MTAAPASTLRNSLTGKPCKVKKREADWNFNFIDVNVAVSVPWRIVTDEGIAYGSEDDGQWFGLPQPVNGEARANELLRERAVVSVSVNGVTGDLSLDFDGGSRLDLFNNSSGYEGWVADLPFGGAKRTSIIALGWRSDHVFGLDVAFSSMVTLHLLNVSPPVPVPSFPAPAMP